MKYFVLFSLGCMLLLSCGKNKQVDSTENSLNENVNQTYLYKVAGLSDSILSDTLINMIFVVEGIDQMSIQKADSLVVIIADSSKVKYEELAVEISNRGGVVLN